MKKILLTQPIPEQVIKPLRSRFEFILSPDPSDETVRKYISGVDGLLVRTGTRLSRETIFAARSLKVIGRTGVGVDNVDIEAASEAGIPVCYTPEANSVSVAEHTMAFILAISKNLLNLDRETKQGNWKVRDRSHAIDLSGKTLGLLGFGRIGRAMFEIAKVFGIEVSIYDPFIPQELIPNNVKFFTNLKEFVSAVDIISVHIPLSPETKGIIDYDTIIAMKKDAILINTSRGSIINERDLEKALEEGWLSGVGLDVFENEPHPKNCGLNKFDRVYMTPHSAALTKECRLRMATHAMQGIVDVLEKRSPQWVFNQRELTNLCKEESFNGNR
ncbi:hydroxyacid dehydrogenase [Bacillus sp. FJAT-50079]|uniref:hydroxyacid dehydrogenase n=1 Tax=Bacillus sp. FJAT-50079 TaxID=2833577 RepID=UPI001BC9E457|nr:hydroxyacid dehydrogenase [Bacillus sp. FJAT-50079]MBS4208216.1 hydroxyacid dehydrogenase [Bacillus sp. FJAT-50079]